MAEISFQRQLVKFNFTFITDKMVSDPNHPFYEEVWAIDKWVLQIPGGRRGQIYFLFWGIDAPTELRVNSTSPDGSGREAQLPLNVIATLIPLLKQFE
jgi:hypothetical protein